MKLLLLSMIVILTSCSHALHQVHLSDHNVMKSAKNGKIIKSNGEQKVFMGFVFETNYVTQARNKLISQCTSGEIKNIMTRYSTSHGFLHWTNKVYMEGRCFK